MRVLLNEIAESGKNIELDYTIIQSLFKQLRSVMYIMNNEMQPVYITPSVFELTGFSSDDLLKKDFWQTLVHPDDWKVCQEYIEQLAELDTFEITLRVKHANGKYLLLHNSGTVQKENGKVTNLLGSIRLESEMTIFTNSKNHRDYYIEQLMDSLGLAFYAIDRDFRITAKNKVFTEWMKKNTQIDYEIGDSIFYENADKEIVENYISLFNKAFEGEFVEDAQILNNDSMHIAMTPVYLNNRVEGVAVLHLNKTKESKLLDALIKMNKKVESIFNSSDELIYTLDKDLNFISFNETYKKLYTSYYGIEPQLGHKTLNRHGDAVDMEGVDLMDYFQKTLEGEDLENEFKLKKSIFHIKFRALKDNKDNIFGASVYCKNITNIKESEKKLKESEQKFKYVVDHVTDIVFQTDGEGNWTYLNNAWKTIMEYELDECINTLFFTYLHPEDVEKNQRLFTPLINREKSYCSHEIRYITKSGKIKWIRVFATLLLNDDDEIIGTTGTLKDISAEKENSYRYELLSMNSNDLICIHEMDVTFIYVSPSSSNILGISPEYLIGKSGFDLVHPEDIDHTRKEVEYALSSGKSNFRISFRVLTGAGIYIWVETIVNIIYDPYFGRKIMISSTRNINESKLAEQQMIKALETEKQLNDLKSKFVSMASHEFRTPMTAIKSSAEIADLYLSGFNDEKIGKVRNHIKTIDLEVDRLTELVNNILLLSKIESNSIQLNTYETDIVDAVKNIAARQKMLQENNRSVNFKSTGIPQKAFLDPLHLKHIVDNLLSNAFKYSVGKKDPELVLNFLDNEFEIVVKDHGIGIPKEEHEDVFKSFFRAKNTGTINGTGLGLVLVHHFVSMHEGSVRFESDTNKGTSFFIKIPYQIAAAE